MSFRRQMQEQDVVDSPLGSSAVTTTTQESEMGVKRQEAASMTQQ